MNIRTEIVAFVDDLERYAQRTFAHKSELGQLLELAWSTNKTQVIEDAVFHAKFVTRALDIMRRIGRDAEGFAKMEAEFAASTEKALSLLRTLVKEAPDDLKQHFLQTFFSPTEENLPRVLSLFAELTWVKNWMVDGKKLPWEEAP
jgi:hypothetical protein